MHLFLPSGERFLISTQEQLSHSPPICVELPTDAALVPCGLWNLLDGATWPALRAFLRELRRAGTTTSLCPVGECLCFLMHFTHVSARAPRGLCWDFGRCRVNVPREDHGHLCSHYPSYRVFLVAVVNGIFLRFYLFIHERRREAETPAEGEAAPGGLDPGTWGHALSPRQMGPVPLEL